MARVRAAAEKARHVLVAELTRDERVLPSQAAAAYQLPASASTTTGTRDEMHPPEPAEIAASRQVEEPHYAGNGDSHGSLGEHRHRRARVHDGERAAPRLGRATRALEGEQRHGERRCESHVDARLARGQHPCPRGAEHHGRRRPTEPPEALGGRRGDDDDGDGREQRGRHARRPFVEAPRRCDRDAAQPAEQRRLDGTVVPPVSGRIQSPVSVCASNDSTSRGSPLS